MRKFVLLTLVIALCFIPACGTNLSAEEQDYIWGYNLNQDWTLSAVNDLLDLIAVWSPENQAWSKEVITQIAIINVSYEDARGMNPPDSMAQIHIKYLRAMGELDSIADPIITGIAYNYETVPGQVIINLDIGMQHLAETQALIDNF